jgi:hypothetical protein
MIRYSTSSFVSPAKRHSTAPCALPFREAEGGVVDVPHSDLSLFKIGNVNSVVPWLPFTTNFAVPGFIPADIFSQTKRYPPFPGSTFAIATPGYETDTFAFSNPLPYSNSIGLSGSPAHQFGGSTFETETCAMAIDVRKENETVRRMAIFCFINRIIN